MARSRKRPDVIPIGARFDATIATLRPGSLSEPWEAADFLLAEHLDSRGFSEVIGWPPAARVFS